MNLPVPSACGWSSKPLFSIWENNQNLKCMLLWESRKLGTWVFVYDQKQNPQEADNISKNLFFLLREKLFMVYWDTHLNGAWRPQILSEIKYWNKCQTVPSWRQLKLFSLLLFRSRSRSPRRRAHTPERRREERCVPTAYRVSNSPGMSRRRSRYGLDCGKPSCYFWRVLGGPGFFVFLKNQICTFRKHRLMFWLVL